MYEIIICIAMANCGWTVIVAENPISCNRVPVDGCTYYDAKIIYLKDWNLCVLYHEIQEHALKRNNTIHYGIC